MNTNKLRGKIAEKGIPQAELAKEIGISYNTLNRKLRGKNEFTLSEMMALCRILDIDDPVPIFFS